MSATLAKSAAPPWALMCWVSDGHVFVELPGKNMTHVMKFAFSEGGLNKALNLLRDRHNANAAPVYRAPDPILSNRKAVGTVAQQRSAQSVLRRLGMIP